MKKFFSNRTVPLLALSSLLGIFIGLALFTFFYAKGPSYFSDNPKTCVNCHIMNPQYTAWQHSSHRNVASCNDCHTPDGFVPKWFVKGLNGWYHSVAFTTGNFSEPIRIREFNATIVHNNCLDCHQGLTDQMSHSSEGEPLVCTSCHADVGHRL